MSGVFWQDFPCSETDADAPVLVLLHGWGMHSVVWESFIPVLTPHASVRCIDLPGFGRSAGVPMPTTPEAMVDVLLDVVPASAVWMGWSLGGLLAMVMAARYPQRVSHLMLMAATPCFVQKQDWPCAMPAQEFDVFANAVKDDAALTLKRFLMLQCHGTTSHKQDLRFLQSCLVRQPAPSREALEQGLALLGNNDYRALLSTLSLPVLCLLGEHDALIPASVAPVLLSLLPSSMVRVVSGAAHVPFLSHPQVCRDAVLDLIGTVS
jgi:pimeloyl-[acyl-carrier protein] methyl ester esterase